MYAGRRTKDVWALVSVKVCLMPYALCLMPYAAVSVRMCGQEHKTCAPKTTFFIDLYVARLSDNNSKVAATALQGIRHKA